MATAADTLTAGLWHNRSGTIGPATNGYGYQRLGNNGAVGNDGYARGSAGRSRQALVSTTAPAIAGVNRDRCPTGT